MRKIKKFTTFIGEAFLNRDREEAINLILEYLKRKAGVNLYSYDECWNIQKGPIFLKGQLYLSLNTSKALRFNWKEGDLRSELDSIDLWSDFQFDTNPEFTLLISGNSVSLSLSKILDFWKNPKSAVVSDSRMALTEEFETDPVADPKGRLDIEMKKLSRMRNPERIELQKRKIERIEAIIAESERSSTESEKVTQLDAELNIDVFKLIELYTTQVARGKSNSLIISGDAGVGKTRTVKDTLDSLGMVKDTDYYIATGTATTAGLYELLFNNRKSLLIFDDCDAVFKDPESTNLLKGALDTYEIREISKLSKGNTFDSTGLSDEEIDVQAGESGKLPNKFDFRGQVIFISNLTESKFDSALLSRSLHVDVHLTKMELFERMKSIMKKLAPDVENEKKLEALEYLTDICKNYPTKFDLNIRTLIHSINLRAHNEGTMTVDGKEIAVWKLLIKKYLVKTR